MKKMCMLVIVAGWLILPVCSEGYNIVIQPDGSAGKDTFNVSGGWLENPNTNWETHPVIIAGYFNGGYAIRRSFLQFDLSSIPAGSEITNATLTFWAAANTYYGAVSQTVSAYQMLVDWEESQVNWYNRKTGVTWNNSGCTNDGVDVKVSPENSVNIYYPVGSPWIPYSFNLTSLVQKWHEGIVPNYGMLLRGANESNTGKEVCFISSDYSDASFRPKLEVTVVPEPSTLFLLGTTLLGLVGLRKKKKD